MTPIIKVEQGYVAVSLNPASSVIDGKHYYCPVHRVLYKATFDHEYFGNELDVIASTFPLEGVPLFELPDEIDINKLSIKHFPYRKDGGFGQETDIRLQREGFVDGYKAAQQNGTYTEEQLVEGLLMMRERDENGKVCHDIPDVLVRLSVRKEKDIVGVDFEMNESCKDRCMREDCDTQDCVLSEIPKLTNGKLTVKKIYYKQD